MYLILILLASNIIYCNGRLKYRKWFDEFDLALTEYFNCTRPLDMDRVLENMFMLDGLMLAYEKMIPDARFFVQKVVKDIYESTPFRGPTFLQCVDKHKLSNINGMTDRDILDVVVIAKDIKKVWENTLTLVFKNKNERIEYEDKLVELGLDTKV